jgi:hypothetical protein
LCGTRRPLPSKSWGPSRVQTITKEKPAMVSVVVCIIYSSVSHAGRASADATPSLVSTQYHQRQILQCKSTAQYPTREAPGYRLVYFFPLFLIPWVPVLRGPLLFLAFAAISAFAFASVVMISIWPEVHRLLKSNRLSASLGMPYLPRPSRPWEPSSGLSKA